MGTQKVAITMPTELVAVIDDISRQKGMSRSKFISTILEERILSEKQKQIRKAYNRVFSDALILKEQLETAAWFEGAENREGQEW